MTQGAKALLMLSGGLDSALCMHRALSWGHSLHVHHITLRNREGRHRMEDHAVDQILRWMKRQGLTNFSYSQSAFDFGTMTHTTRDLYLWAFVAGQLLSDPRHADVKELICTRHLGSHEGHANPQSALESYDGIVQHLPQFVSRRDDVGVSFPLNGMTKAEIIAALPPDLMRLCWYCRRPRGSQPCHQCPTCIQVDAALK